MVLSLASCPNCIMMDDELNVLPTSSLIKYIEPVRGLGAWREAEGHAAAQGAGSAPAL